MTISNKFTGGANPNQINPTVLGQYATYADLPSASYYVDLTLAYVRDSKTLYQVQSGAWVASSAATGISRVTKTADPTANDDITLGYTAGTVWERTDDPKLFICTDPTAGAAVWVSLWRATDLNSYGSKVTQHAAPGSALTVNLADSNVHIISGLTGNLAVSFNIAGRVDATRATEITVIVETAGNTVSFPDVVGTLPSPSGSTWDVYRFIVAYLGGTVVYLPRLSGGYSTGGAVADTTPPALPTSFVGTPGANDGTLTWVDPADADLASIKVYKGLTSGGPYTLVATVAAGTQTWTDTTLAIGTPGYYVLTSVDATGNESGQTAEVSMALGVVNLWPDPTLASSATPSGGTSTITHTTKSFGDVGASVNVVEWHQADSTVLAAFDYTEIAVTPGQPLNLSFYYTADAVNFAKWFVELDVDGVMYYAYDDGTWQTVSNELTPVFSGSGTLQRYDIQMDAVPAGSVATLKVNGPYRGTYPFDAEISGVQITESTSVLPYQGSTPSATTQSATFTEDTTTDFSNPERGLWSTSAASNPTPAAPWNTVAPNMTIEWWNLELGAFRSTAIDAATLTSITNRLAAYRSTDCKVVIRPRYATAYGDPDAPINIVLQHIGQLGPIFTTYSDVIMDISMGFVSYFGEWGLNYSTNDLIFGSDGSGLYRDQIKDAAFANFPTDRMIAFRRPNLVGPADQSCSGNFGWQVSLPAYASRFSGTEQYRMALYNDCFMVDANNGSWWDAYDCTSDAQDRAISAAVTRITVMHGETCDSGGVNAYNQGQTAIDTMKAVHMDALHASYWTPIFDGWATDGILAEISRSLGYRFVMKSVTVPTSAAAGDTINVSLTMDNVGWGKLFNARPLKLVLRPTGGGSDVEITMLSDARTSMPLGSEGPTTMALTATIPGGTAAGTYSLHLKMPDASANLSSRIGCMIRFANVGTWDGATGVNSLGLTLTLT